MTTFQANNETILINDKFGLITDNQVIITKGSKKSKVPVSYTHLDVYKRQLLHCLINLLVKPFK